MSIRLQHPVPGGTPTDPFGWRGAVYSNGVMIRPPELHNGQDWAAPLGTPVYAAHAGRVQYAGWDPLPGWSGAGNAVQIGAANVTTQYLHLDRTAVRAGQHVKAGQLIGYVGSTGFSTGPHLHFSSILPGGQYVNPAPYLRSTPTTRRKPTMFMIYTDAYKNDKARPGRRWAVIGGGAFIEIYDQDEANTVKAAIQGGPSVKVSGERYRFYRAAVQAG